MSLNERLFIRWILVFTGMVPGIGDTAELAHNKLRLEHGYHFPGKYIIISA